MHPLNGSRQHATAEANNMSQRGPSKARNSQGAGQAGAACFLQDFQSFQHLRIAPTAPDRCGAEPTRQPTAVDYRDGKSLMLLSQV
jgi:hypothetical protein